MNRELVPFYLMWVDITNVSKVQIGKKEPVSRFLSNYNWVDTTFWFCLFHQHVRHLMILKSYRYLSAYNEYCEVNVEGAYIKMKLIIGNRESGTGNWFLAPY